MSPVLVITVAILALAEAGYQYTTPSASLVLPHNKPADFQTGHALQNNIAPINSGFYQPTSLLGGDLKSGNGHFKPVVGSNLNTGTNLNSVYVNTFLPTVNNNLNSGILPTTSNFNSGYAQNFALSGSTVNLDSAQKAALNSNLLQHNAGYTKSFSPLLSANSNKEHAQTFLHSSTNLGNGFPVYSQSPVQLPAGNFNTGSSQGLAATVSSSLNNVYTQKWVPFTTGNLNSAYSQALTPSGTSSLRNGFTQNWIPSANTGNLNSDHTQSLASSGTAISTNGFVQKWIPSVAGNLNTGHSQSLSTSTISGLSQGYSQPSKPSAIGNVNTGYSQGLISRGSDTVYGGYNQISVPHVSTNLNTGNSQPFSSPASVAQTSTSASNDNRNAEQNLIPQPASLSFDAIANDVHTLGANTGVGYSRATGFSNKVSVNLPSTIYKHVYFHVPPPEDEQKIVQAIPQKKKTYKILFIKVPSHETNLQQIAKIRNKAPAAVEHKTLIYVLVKKPETEQSLATPKQTPPEHEVFFVKYNGNPLDLARQVNGELDKSGSVQSAKIPLKPGLVNGQSMDSIKS